MGHSVTTQNDNNSGFALLDGAAQMKRTGLIINRDLSFNEWSAMGNGLQMIEGGIQWALGDWLQYGEHRYGERYAQAVELTGYTYQGLADMAYVASRIDFSRRRENLRISHHREVAALEPAEQDALLQKAEDHHLSVKALREAVQTFRRELAPPTSGRELPVVAVTIHPPEPPNSIPDQIQNERDSPDAQLKYAEELIRDQQSQIDSLIAGDKDREILKLHSQLAQQNARNIQIQREKAEAVKQAGYAESILRKVRKALGVQTDREILPAIEARAA